MQGGARDVEELVDAFLRPPLRQDGYARGMGTLYTAVLEPSEGRARYVWPEQELVQRLERFDEETRVVTLVVPSAA